MALCSYALDRPTLRVTFFPPYAADPFPLSLCFCSFSFPRLLAIWFSIFLRERDTKANVSLVRNSTARRWQQRHAPRDDADFEKNQKVINMPRTEVSV